MTAGHDSASIPADYQRNLLAASVLSFNNEGVLVFRIKDLDFDILSADISAVINRPAEGLTQDPAATELRWHINIEAKDKLVKDVTWSPRAYIEGLRIDVKAWTSFEGLSLNVATASDGVVVYGTGGLYVFEHLPTRNNQVRLCGRHGNTFELMWEAVCDVFAYEYSKNLPLAIRIPAVFKGVEVAGESNVAHAANMLGAHLKAAEFNSQGSVRRYGDGANPLTSVLFSPNAI